MTELNSRGSYSLKVMKITLAVVLFEALTLVVSARTPRDETLNFVMMGDWGGQDDQPYYTKGEDKVKG